MVQIENSLIWVVLILLFLLFVYLNYLYYKNKNKINQRLKESNDVLETFASRNFIECYEGMFSLPLDEEQAPIVKSVNLMRRNTRFTMGPLSFSYQSSSKDKYSYVRRMIEINGNTYELIFGILEKRFYRTRETHQGSTRPIKVITYVDGYYIEPITFAIIKGLRSPYAFKINKSKMYSTNQQNSDNEEAFGFKSITMNVENFDKMHFIITNNEYLVRSVISWEVMNFFMRDDVEMGSYLELKDGYLRLHIRDFSLKTQEDCQMIQDLMINLLKNIENYQN